MTRAFTQAEMESRIVRYGDLQPCKTAFIDAHTPGSDQKENFTIIGGGVSESPDQHVHIRETPGFNIGAAGQPPKCRTSLHSHTTAEVFFVLKGDKRETNAEHRIETLEEFQRETLLTLVVDGAARDEKLLYLCVS